MLIDISVKCILISVSKAELSINIEDLTHVFDSIKILLELEIYKLNEPQVIRKNVRLVDIPLRPSCVLQALNSQRL